MFIQTIPTANDCNQTEFVGKTAVVIDVLRASSVIITALANGAADVIPAISTDQAFSLYEASGHKAILGGEMNALVIEGFHYGNSPLQYTPEIVKNREIILKTTNGTVAIYASSGAKTLIVGAFLNKQAIVEFILNQSNDIVLVCSGTAGKFSMDDALCAGMIINDILIRKQAQCCDLGQTLSQFATGPDTIRHKLINCKHLNYLLSLGFERDVNYCLRTDVLNTVPVFSQGKFFC